MKHAQAIETWLRRKARMYWWLHIAGSGVVFVLGLMFLFLTFWAVYLVLLFAFNWLLPHSHDTRVWISVVIVAVVFVSYLFIDHAELEREMIQSAASDYDPITMTVGRALGIPTASLQTWVKMLTYLVCLGPRLVVQSYQVIRGAGNWTALDVEPCAAALEKLSRKDERVPLDEIKDVIPAGRDMKTIVRQLRLFHGVLLLRAAPVGLKLTPELREELRALKNQPG